jgi:hypothetical protein
MFPSPQSVKEPGNWDGNAQYGETLDRDISVAKGMPEDEKYPTRGACRPGGNATALLKFVVAVLPNTWGPLPRTLWVSPLFCFSAAMGSEGG